MTHTPRTQNQWSDGVAKCAKESVLPLSFWVHCPSSLSTWRSLEASAAESWLLSVDGSTTPEPSYSRGSSGATATLWISHQGNWWPVATVAASSTWSAAVDAEAAALSMAIGLLSLSANVCMHVPCEQWFSSKALTDVLTAAPQECAAGVFASTMRIQ